MTTTPTATINTGIAELGGVTKARNNVLEEVATLVAQFDKRATPKGIATAIRCLKSVAPVAPEPAAAQKETQHQRDRRIISDALKKAKEDWTEMLAERSDRMDWFMSWFVKNYPADTVITDPNWHGPRILAAAEFALKSHPAPQPLAEVSAAQAVPYSCETGQIDEALANFLAEHTRLNQDGIDTHSMTITLVINHAALHPTPESEIAEWREQGYLPPAAQAVPEVAVDEKLCFCKGGLNNHSSGCTEGYPSDLPDYEDYLAKPTDATKDAS